MRRRPAGHAEGRAANAPGISLAGGSVESPSGRKPSGGPAARNSFLASVPLAEMSRSARGRARPRPSGRLEAPSGDWEIRAGLASEVSASRAISAAGSRTAGRLPRRSRAFRQTFSRSPATSRGRTG
ncbi:MAG: hypothetical protein LBG06_00615 [Deltaproteobacteria bacterium]|nr:hypothetical protein [Deltaproteobacteria bacterium]